MQIPFIPQTTQEPNLLVSAKNVPALQVGESVQAEVVNVTDTAVAIRMKNSILEARTNLPLKQGDVLSLLVEEAGSELRLRLVQGNGTEAGSIKNAILAALDTLKDLKPGADDIKVFTAFIASAPQGLKEVLPELSVLEKFALSLEELSGSALKNAVQNSGVFLEAKLRLLVTDAEQEGSSLGNKIQALAESDIKAALLNLKGSLGNKEILDRLVQSGVRSDTLSAAVDNLLKNTELLQLQSRLNGALQVFVPFAWQKLKDGELIFRESERDWPEEDAYLCTVNLDLEYAGKMSARLLLQAGQIYIDVLAENKVFFGLLQDNAAAFRTRLNAAGIKLGGLTIHQTARIDIRPAQAGGLNIRI